jgi:hypothetical protein
MSVAMPYYQVFELVQRLPKSDQLRLMKELQSNETDRSDERVPPKTSEEYYEFVLNFSVIPEDDIQKMLEAKTAIDIFGNLTL